MDEDIYPDELYHYGRKGMKWGQHIFGKERSSGTKKRKKSSEGVENRFVSGVKKAAGKVSAAHAKAKEDKRVQKLKKKKISDMTDDELAEYTDRMNRERMAGIARQNAKQVNPQHVSKGQSFVSSVGRDVLAPAAKTVGRQYLEKVLKDRLGLNDTGKNDPLKGLRDKVDKAELENRFGRAVEEARKRNNPDTEMDNLRREAEEARLKNQRDAANEQIRDREKRNQQPTPADDVKVETPSNNSVRVDDVSVATGYAYIEQNRQLLNTPIAGLLPAPRDDDK